MTMTDQYQRDAAKRGNPCQVLVVVRAWIDNDQLVTERAAQHPGVGAVQRQQTGVVGQQDRRGVGDRAQLAVGGMGQRLSCLRHRPLADLHDQLDFHRRIQR
ncbi:Uncharacterised protein [Mycobacterium tuberculosis]|uniref:Uncharacterized protein n=1 Tax=Mycobacterium tuberculosis TaxID=1773 RepID=A0A916PD08_MYCTX|nr:Uncharacterised protein [Mycobacterium tuberculosis]CPA68864.1 Uncharacterised protein [Mycobacterium tuberculosis]